MTATIYILLLSDTKISPSPTELVLSLGHVTLQYRVFANKLAWLTFLEEYALIPKAKFWPQKYLRRDILKKASGHLSGFLLLLL